MHAGLPDVERLARKLDRRKASLADLCQLYRASSRLPMLVEAFRDYEGPHAEILTIRCCKSASHTTVLYIVGGCGLYFLAALWSPANRLLWSCTVAHMIPGHGISSRTCRIMQICRQAGGCT